MKRLIYCLIVCLIWVLFNACAFDLAHVKQIPTKLEQTDKLAPSFELEKEVNIDIGYGYSRILKQGTKWNYVGTISYGEVYRTKDQILTVEASNIHEAYIVVSSEKLVGFYLPVERSYSPLSDSQKLPLKK